MPRLTRTPLQRAAFTALLAATAFASVSPRANAALKDGAPAPDFKAPASLNGKAFSYSLAEALKKGPVVVYFFPAAFTGGCNIQAHSFAENADRFTRAGATIVGVSLDSIDRLNEFSADPQSCAGKIPVASDADGRIARAYDLTVSDAPAGRKNARGQEILHGRAERTTFIITPDGKVAGTVGGVAPDLNVQRALERVQQLSAARKS